MHDWRRYPPLITKLFPAQRAIMTGGDGDGDEFQFLPWWRLPTLVPDSLYSLNPIFTLPLGAPPTQSYFWRELRMRGNATFSMGDLGGGSQALAQKFGGARAVWDAGVCNFTQSFHMYARRFFPESVISRGGDDWICLCHVRSSVVCQPIY
jgi:hypothetical protein